MYSVKVSGQSREGIKYVTFDKYSDATDYLESRGFYRLYANADVWSNANRTAEATILRLL